LRTTGDDNRQLQSGPLGSRRKSTKLLTKKEGGLDQTGNLERNRRGKSQPNRINNTRSE
jgi:hypothetical protein